MTAKMDDDQRKAFAIIESFIIPESERTEAQLFMIVQGIKGAETYAGECIMENADKPDVPITAEEPRVRQRLIALMSQYIREGIDQSSTVFNAAFGACAAQLLVGMAEYMNNRARNNLGGLLNALMSDNNSAGITVTRNGNGRGSGSGSSEESPLAQLRRKRRDLQMKRLDAVEKLEDIDRDLERNQRRIDIVEELEPVAVAAANVSGNGSGLDAAEPVPVAIPFGTQ